LEMNNVFFSLPPLVLPVLLLFDFARAKTYNSGSMDPALYKDQGLCSCADSGDAGAWEGISKAMFELLEQDPYMTGGGVHAVCQMGYALLYRDSRFLDSEGAVVTVSDCTAGVLSMAVICLQSSVANSATGEGAADRRGAWGQVQLLREMIPSLLELCVHCLDTPLGAFKWPFSTREVLANLRDLTDWEYMVHLKNDYTGEFWGVGASRVPKPWRRLTQGPRSASLFNPSSLDVDRLRFEVRWVRGLVSEAGFWHSRMNQTDLVKHPTELRRLLHYLKTGNIRWYHDSADDLCNVYIKPSLHSLLAHHQLHSPVVRVLNSGSGPFAPLGFDCEMRYLDQGLLLTENIRTEVHSSDALARTYMALFNIFDYSPPARVSPCAAENLLDCFPPEYFNMVYMRNALDHAWDPLEGIRQMLAVTRPGGFVLLRHADNEGVAGSFRCGLHQWAFTVELSESAHELTSEQIDRGVRSVNGDFIIWNPSIRINVNRELAEVADVFAYMHVHPSFNETDTRYVNVDIRKK
jgi:hypothetical protein